MVLKVALRDERLLTDVALERLLTLMLDTNVLVDAGLVKGLLTNWTVGVQVGLLVLG